MLNILFKHYWLENKRSPGFYRNLAVTIFMGLMVLYFVLLFVLLGFMLPQILAEAVPDRAPAELFHGSILYAVIALLFFRYMMQPLSRINLQAYQVLPLKRSTLVNYLLLKPLLNPLNYALLCIVIPFAISGIYPDHGTVGFFRFILSVIPLIAFNTLLAPLLKRQFSNMLIGMALLLAVTAVPTLLEYFGILSLFGFSRHLFGMMTSTPLVWVAAWLLPLGAFWLNRLFFARNYYPESFEKKTTRRQSDTKRFTFMERFGKIGELISLEIKLVLRHKRTKSTLFTALLFLLYGLLFYPNPMYNESPGWLLFVAIFVTGTGMLMFGQWIINWDGSHFDFLMTRDIETSTYIRANYFLMLALCIFSFIATTPYFLFGTYIIPYHVAALLYNAGVNIHIYLFGATFNTKRLELSRGSSMNMQGVSYKNFIVMIPLLLVPILLVNLFALFSASHVGLIILSLLGLAGILFREPLLRVTEKQFLKRKYALCTGFRKKE